MARYRRPKVLSQRNDPTEAHLAHENNNCTAVSAAMALDAHSGGRKQKRGGQLRHVLPNPNSGMFPGVGLSLQDMEVAWRRNGENLEIDQGWDNMVRARSEGRGLIAQGDSGRLDGSCSEGQDVEHAIYIHPDTSASGDWLVADPWCYRRDTKGLGKWRWLPRSEVRAYAEALGFRFAYTRRLPRI